MNRKKINHLYKNRGMWYVRYKDPLSKRWKGISTGLKMSSNNLQLAKEIRDKFFEDLTESLENECKPGSLESAFNEFYKLNSNKSESTKSTYNYYFDYFKRHFDISQPCLSVNKLTAEKFLMWLQSLEELSTNTKYGIQKNFKKFLRFLFEYNYLPRVFYLNKDVLIKRQESEPIIFTEKDRKKILDKLDEEDKNLNFKLETYLLLYTGLRPSDIIGLTKEQIDLKKMEIRFYSSKTGSWFVRPLHPALKPILKERCKKIGVSEKLFNYAEEKNMGKAFQRYLQKIGLGNKNYNLRTFRKDFISRSQEAGVPITATALLVGHRSIKTTMAYYTKLSTNYLKKELKKVI